jgi:hypothetical protein
VNYEATIPIPQQYNTDTQDINIQVTGIYHDSNYNPAGNGYAVRINTNTNVFSVKGASGDVYWSIAIFSKTR